MAFDWTEQDKGGSPLLPVGEDVDVQITRVVYAKKDGIPMRSSSGDPKIMLVFADDIGREATYTVTLSEKAGFRLRQIMSAAGMDMNRMKADNVQLHWFADQSYGNRQLVGRRLRIRVSAYVQGYDGIIDQMTPVKRLLTAPARSTPPAPASAPASAPPPPPAPNLMDKAVANAAKEGPPPPDQIPF